MAIRREFRDMSKEDRKSFTDAATCLMNTPPQHMRTDQAADYPGIKTRHDEYVATHINMTMRIQLEPRESRLIELTIGATEGKCCSYSRAAAWSSRLLPATETKEQSISTHFNYS